MKISLICVALFVFACVSFTDAKTKWFELEDYSFEQYVKEYGKSYPPEEYEMRRKIFETRLAGIQKHNRDTTKTWKRGINHLSAHTPKEFRQLLGFRKDLSYESKAKRGPVPSQEDMFDLKQLPKTVDWRQRGVVTAVKDQGQCGSCWSFATAESVESYYALATGKLAELSEQQVLDCTPNPNQCGGTGGCGGGTTEIAFAQIMQQGGLSSEWTYPYLSYYGQNFQCNSGNLEGVAQLSGYQDLPSNQYTPVMNAVATSGPLAISVDASAWSEYESGVFDGCNQTNPDIDHAVQLVGYGTDPSLGDYWLVRNSWSPAWGEDGYIRLRRTSNEAGRCGIDITPSDGTGCKGGPPQVKVCGTCAILYDVSYPQIQTTHKPVIV